MKRCNYYENLKEFEEHFWRKILKTKTCWEWQAGISEKGYGIVNVRFFKTSYAHRIAYILTTGKILPSEIHILHKCDNPKCCNPEHLFEGTHKDNMMDKSLRQRQTNAKLTRTDAINIRNKYGERYKNVNLNTKDMENIASEYKVHRMTISRILREKTYKTYDNFQP